MKKLFPIAALTVFSLVVYTSCQKKTQYNETHYCYCAWTDIRGNDSLGGNYSGYSAQYSFDKAEKQCMKFQDSVAATKPGFKCIID